MDNEEYAENQIIAFSIMAKKKFNEPTLIENCHKLERMIVQNTAGQPFRKGNKKDISFDELFRVKSMIIVETLALVREIENDAKRKKH